MFEQSISIFSAGLHRYCRMLTGTPYDPDDLYQETVLKACKAGRDFAGHPALRAFLFRWDAQDFNCQTSSALASPEILSHNLPYYSLC